MVHGESQALLTINYQPFTHMFRLSQKAYYGLILLASLYQVQVHFRSVSGSSKAHSGSERGGDAFVSISSVAAKNQIPQKFLSQIATELKKAGMIKSKEGVSGGFMLAKKPTDIKLLDVLETLDGELVVGECFEDDHECHCGGKFMWQDLKKQLEATIGSKTVADLVVH